MLQTELRRKHDASPEPEVRGDGERLPAALTTIVERVILLTGADGVAVALCEPEGVFCQASTGQAPPVGSRLQPDAAFTRECLETGQPVLCEDAENDARVERSVARALHLRSALAVPIQAQGSVLGVVEVFSCRPSAFNAEHVSELQRIAGILSPILLEVRHRTRSRLQVRYCSPPKRRGRRLPKISPQPHGRSSCSRRSAWSISPRRLQGLMKENPLRKPLRPSSFGAQVGTGSQFYGGLPWQSALVCCCCYCSS